MAEKMLKRISYFLFVKAEGFEPSTVPIKNRDVLNL
jgi:hypothetical protein